MLEQRPPARMNSSVSRIKLARVSGEKDKSEAKLAKFGDTVPPAVVEQERARLQDWSAKLEALSAQRARLA